MKKKKFWYKFTHYYCPQCGKEKVFQDRITNIPKPKRYDDRHIFREIWDYCGL